MNDEKQTRRKLILSTFWIVLGITLVVLTGTGTIPDAAWSGMGGGFIGVGIMQLLLFPFPPLQFFLFHL